MREVFFYPYAVLAVIVFNFYVQNSGMFTGLDAAIFIAASAFVLLVINGVLKTLYKNPEKAALLSLLLLISFYFLGKKVEGQYLAAFTAGVSAILLYFKKPPQFVGKVLNLFSLVLLVVSIAFGSATVFSKMPSKQEIAKTEVDSFSGITRNSFSAKPSVVHIVLDGYSNDQALKAYYGFDNKSFTNDLKGLGFTVFPQAGSPYNQTLLVMNSIFSGSYVHESLVGALETNQQIRVRLGKLFLNGGLVQSLRDAGYQYYFSDPAYDYIEPPAHATVLSNHYAFATTAEFAYHFLQSTVVKHFIEDARVSLPTDKYKKAYDAAFSIHENMRFKEPFFLYQHVLAPHPPFYHDENGNDVGVYKGFGSIADGSHAIRGEDARFQAYKQGYINKLKVTNGKVLNQLPKIISNIKGDYVVIIHGDHGGGLLYNQNNPNESCINERFSPYLAVVTNMPSLKEKLSLYQDSEFNLVNLYRLILSDVTDKELGQFEKKSIFIAWSDLTASTDVTDKLHAVCAIKPLP